MIIKQKESKFCKWCGKDFQRESSSYLNYCGDECRDESMKRKSKYLSASNSGNRRSYKTPKC